MTNLFTFQDKEHMVNFIVSEMEKELKSVNNNKIKKKLLSSPMDEVYRIYDMIYRFGVEVFWYIYKD